MPPKSKKSSLSKALAKASTKPPPLWEGPAGKGKNGGVTQGLLARYLTCKERARVHLVDGLRPRETFRAPLEFGSMWHVCEEALAAENPDIEAVVGEILGDHVMRVCATYPFQQQEVRDWADKCAALFPRYVDYWKAHPDVVDRKPLEQEHAFDVSYKLPSGRTVRLRGKRDSTDLIGGGVWLQENKAKSSVDGSKLARQLPLDLQTNFYLTALRNDPWTGCESEGHYCSDVPPHPVAGVRYNVVRRAAHKTVASMLEKLELDLRKGRADEWFLRLKLPVTAEETARFCRRTLDPVLENLFDDWEWWERCHHRTDGVHDYSGDPFNSEERERRFPDHAARHFVMPYFYNPLLEGGTGDVDEFLASGTTVGLHRAEILFPELEPTN